MTIAHIDDGESGGSIRSRLNEVIDFVNDGGTTSESITSGADPVEADPNIAITIWTTGGTKGTETVTLANPSDTDKVQIKTFALDILSGDLPSLSVSNSTGFTSPIAISNNGGSAMVQLVWNPALATWQVLVGGAIFTNGNDINALGGEINADAVHAVSVTGDTVAAANGVSGTFSTTDGVVTVVGGIITGIPT